MGTVNNGRRGVLNVAGMQPIAVGVQDPTDSEAATTGVSQVVAFLPPGGTRQIKAGDIVTLDGVALRVISYGPSGLTRGLVVMQLGAVVA